jgi:hypothetical protein
VNPTLRSANPRAKTCPWGPGYATDGAPSILCWGKSAEAGKVGHPPRMVIVCFRNRPTTCYSDRKARVGSTAAARREGR